MAYEGEALNHEIASQCTLKVRECWFAALQLVCPQANLCNRWTLAPRLGHIADQHRLQHRDRRAELQQRLILGHVAGVRLGLCVCDVIRRCPD